MGSLLYEGIRYHSFIHSFIPEETDNTYLKKKERKEITCTLKLINTLVNIWVVHFQNDLFSSSMIIGKHTKIPFYGSIFSYAKQARDILAALNVITSSSLKFKK